jgi:hypothetical protein
MTEDCKVVELVVLACLLVEQKHCEEFHVPVAVACMARPASLEVIRWATEHPRWTIKKWTCGPPRA